MQKSLPADTSEKEIFKNAPTLNWGSDWRLAVISNLLLICTFASDLRQNDLTGLAFFLMYAI